MKPYKPENYNSLSAYLIVDDAAKLFEQLKNIFGATELRKFEDNGRIRHMEIKIDDSVLMLCDSLPDYPAEKAMLFCYVEDVHETYRKAIENGAESIEEPSRHGEENDIRGAFLDCCGNYWGIGTDITER